MYVLLVESGRLRREVAVGDSAIVLGRGPTATVRLPDDYCSREHARFLFKDDRLLVEDLGARNGIFVNDERVLLDCELSDGDVVRLGRTSVRVRRADAATETNHGTATDLNDTSTKDLGPEGIQFVDPAMELGFSLQRLVAVSGMGLLFEARDKKTNDTVAFKILRPDRATEANVARAVEEAKSLASIQHKNVVRILSTGRMKNGESFLVMDFVHGLTATQLGKARRLWVPEALQMGSDVLAALQAVHDRNMVHRDIKPSNIMLEEKSRRTVLIDFSLALTEAGGLASAPAGTIIFCAPEQVQPRAAGDTLHPAVDIYGFGGTLYYMLVGAHPFRGTSTIEIQKRKIEGPLPSTADKLKGRGVPEIDMLLHACLQPDPDDRPQTVADVKRELDRIRARYPKPHYSEESRLIGPSPVTRRRTEKRR